MPYKNVPPELTGKMDRCVKRVMKQGRSKPAAIAICYTSVVGKELIAKAKEDLDGVMICLKIPAYVADLIEFEAPDALPKDEYHVTLAYLGEAGELPYTRDKLIATIEKWAEYQYPIKGRFNGAGRFNPEDGRTPFYLNFDAPELPAMRESLVSELKWLDMPASRRHGFTPHTTLAYIPAGDATPSLRYPADEMIFRQITVVWGAEWYGVDLGPRASFAERVKAALKGLLKHKTKLAPLTVFKQDDGTYRWVLYTSNSFQDKSKEIVSQAALETDVIRADKESAYGPLRWWHVGKPDPLTRSPGPGVDLGECDFNAMHGRILIESGTFKSAKIARAIGKAAPNLQVSTGFFHPTSEPVDGVYHNIRRFERSLLPRGKAANPFTASLVIRKEKAMVKEKIKALQALLGGDDELVQMVLAQGKALEDAAIESGAAFKEDGEEETPEEKPTETVKMGGEETEAEDDMEEESEAETEEKEAALIDALTAIVTKAVEPLAAEIETLRQTATLKDNERAELAGTVKAQAETIGKLDARLKELEGEQPRAAAKGYRASQAEETVVKGDEASKPSPDNEFIKFAVGGQ